MLAECETRIVDWIGGPMTSGIQIIKFDYYIPDLETFLDVLELGKKTKIHPNNTVNDHLRNFCQSIIEENMNGEPRLKQFSWFRSDWCGKVRITVRIAIEYPKPIPFEGSIDSQLFNLVNEFNSGVCLALDLGERRGEYETF